MKTKIRQLVNSIPIIKKAQKEKAFRKKFKVEIALLKNRHTTHCEVGSVIHFSINKAATQYVKSVLKKIADENDLTPVSIHEYAFFTKIPYLDSLSVEEMAEYQHLFKPQGYLYSVFGGMIDGITDMDSYKVILSVRDPRDILVSNYYSTTLSHPVPPPESDKRDEFLKVREWAKSIGIDEYVLSEMEKVRFVFERYKNSLVSTYNNVVVVKYENMVSNYESWLTDLANKAGLKISDQLHRELSTKFEQNRVKKENKFAHVRKGVAGDFKEKLQAETIDQLNAEFDEVLRYFGYVKENVGHLELAK